MTPYTPEEGRLTGALRVLAFVAAALTLVTLVGTYFGPSTKFFREPPWVSNTAAGLGLIAVMSWIGAADIRRFRTIIRLLIVGLLIGALACLVLIASPSGSNQILLPVVVAAIAGLFAAGIAWLQRQAGALPPVLPWETEKPWTAVERVGQVIFGLFGILSLVFAAVLFALAFVGPATAFFAQPLFLAGSTLKIGLLGLLALTTASQVRRHQDLITLLIVGHAVSFVAGAITLIGIGRFGATTVTMFGVTLSTSQIMLGAWLNDVPIIFIAGLLQTLMARSRLDYLGYLSPIQFRTIEALADSLIEADQRADVPSHAIALRLDRYLSAFPSKRLALTRLAVMGLELLPLAWLLPPFSLLAPAMRHEFVDQRYKHDRAPRQGRRPLRDLIFDQINALLRITMQGVYIGYYSDPKVHETIGYVPFSKRDPNFDKITRTRRYPPLVVTTPEDVRRQGLDVISSADVVIIGSGAAGAILAEQLLAQGRDVLMLERGLYVKPDDFTEDEVQMIGRLYADGALQTTQSYRFQILQGSCVGGSTVVNNAVCFDTPQRVLDRWNAPDGGNAGIDEVEFWQAQKAIKERLSIQSIKQSTTTHTWQDVLNPGDRVIEAGVKKLGLRPGDRFDVVNANISDCLGCGYCNIGCAYGRKLSMLDEVLPKAQLEHGAECFRIFSEAEVVRLNGSGGTVNEIVVQLRDGRQLIVRNPKTVVVSAGTVASSWLLMRSGIGQGELPVGQHLSFNMGSPLHGYWPSVDGKHLKSYAGLQIAHYLELGDQPGFVFETWFNPPVAQAMAMPGWLETHDLNMRRYADLSAVGVLVGTEATAYITPALILRGAPDVVYRPSDDDLNTLVDALTYLGRVMFAGGAAQVMASSAGYRYGRFQEAIFNHPDELARLRDLVKSDRDIILGTGHPQGGNAISRTRGQGKGVVGPDFRVHGYDNLYVCDASVFPSATTVNPQLTIMTLAHYAASRIA